MPMRIRFLASGGATRSQSGFGTTPNIAPPSRAKNPSLSGTSSRLPSVIEGIVTSVAVPPGLWTSHRGRALRGASGASRSRMSRAAE